MPVDTSYAYEISRIKDLPACAGGPVTEYAWFPVSTVATADPAPTPRVLPGKPLWQYPTARPKVWTAQLNWGRIHRTTYGTTCYPKQPYSDLSWTVAGSEGMKVAFATDLDWQTQMRLKIKDYSVNLGTALAEYRQTSNMFRDAGVGVYNAWKSFKGKRKSRRKLRPCDVAASELIYSYGVAPLISDVYDSMDVFVQRLERPIHRRIVSTAWQDDAINLSAPDGDFIGRINCSERAIAYITLDPNKDQNFIMGNPLELAWEVLPFSFVVDWLIPIGDYLSALDALKGVSAVTGTVTRKEEYHHLHIGNAVRDGIWVEDVPNTYHYNSYERKIISAIPLPRVPKWDPSTSWAAIRHAVSLLTVLNQRCS